MNLFGVSLLVRHYLADSYDLSLTDTLTRLDKYSACLGDSLFVSTLVL